MFAPRLITMKFAPLFAAASFAFADDSVSGQKHFTAELGDWNVDASSDELVISVPSTKVTWRSALPAVTARVRTARDHIGGWHHDVHREKAGGKANFKTGRRTKHGVELVGDITLPTGVVEQWTMDLVPKENEHGGSAGRSLDFKLRLANASAGALNPKPSEEGCGKRIQACYTYGSTDVSLSWQMDKHERIFGGGEQYTKLDLRGQRFNVWSAEQGIGRGRDPISSLVAIDVPYQGGDDTTTYSAVPALLSNRGYGVVLENGQLTEVDLRSKHAGTMTVSFEDTETVGSLEVSGSLLVSKDRDVRGLLPELTRITGRMEAPPSWTSEGLVVGAEGGHEAVSQILDTLLAADVPVAAVWIQDWSGMVSVKNGDFVWWNWALDENRYPKAWFKDLRKRGIKVLTYVNPFLVATPNSDGREPTVFLEALNLGYVLKDTKGEPIVMPNPANGVAYGQIDVFNPEAFEWWVQILRCNVMMACDDDEDSEPLVHGWMHDYAEQLLLNASVPTELGRASDVHNYYTRRYAEAAAEATKKHRSVAFFTRSGDLHSPSASRTFWLGDQLTSWDACDGMQSAIIGAMSGGMSGWTITHCDLGGFTMIDALPIPGAKFVRQSELLARWLELGAFLSTAMYRSHPGLKPTGSAQVWDAELLNSTRTMTTLYRELGSYRDAVIEDATSKGLPPVRHGSLVYPGDEEWFKSRSNGLSLIEHLQCNAGKEVGLQQFFLGDELLVSPVLAPGKTDVEVYLPEGSWTHLATGKSMQGPQHSSVAAPIGMPAAFYRSDGKWANFFKNLSATVFGSLSAEALGDEPLASADSLTV